MGQLPFYHSDQGRAKRRGYKTILVVPWKLHAPGTGATRICRCSVGREVQSRTEDETVNGFDGPLQGGVNRTAENVDLTGVVVRR